MPLLTFNWFETLDSGWFLITPSRTAFGHLEWALFVCMTIVIAVKQLKIKRSNYFPTTTTTTKKSS
jgi:hypothetical protein